ncbi:MAG: acetyltransferase [Burkholderiaceae bacterium]|jgi:sugar O-acyltransferase (sialic acid O-acetyltransferase NeuD family)|nr:acetyltransferase [Burkholderiaceae bacterium]
MRRKLLIYGTGVTAELAWFYFTRDSAYEVAAFTVDSAYLAAPRFCGLPVTPFERIAHTHPPGEYDFFVAVANQNLNAFRRDRYLAAKALGYPIARYISSRAHVFQPENIGENCLVTENATVHPLARVGNNVTLFSGCVISHHSVIHDHCYIAPGAVIGGECVIGEQCFIGLNAAVRSCMMVGERCIVGAGAVILNHAAPEGVYRAHETARSHIASTDWYKTRHP